MSKTNVQSQQVSYPLKGHFFDLQNPHLDIASLGDPYAELAKVEADVEKVTAVLASLLSRVHNLKAQINVAKSPFLRMLPSEIIAEIFTFCLEVPGPDDDPSKVDNVVPLRIGAVCNAFRTVAWSTPQLWATVVLDIKSAWRIPSQATLLSDWLSRSGHLPLSIWLNSSEDVHWAFARPELILKVINVVSHRWKYVDIRLPSSCYRFLPPSEEPLPLLQSLTLKPPGGQGDRTHRIDICKAPELRCITLQCLYLRSIKFAWSILTALDLESFYIDESLEILRQTINLVHLNVRRILGGDDSHAIPTEPIDIPVLSSFILVNDKATDISTLLNKITTPALQTLSFASDGATHAPYTSFTSLFSRSACALKALTLKHCSIASPDFKKLLLAIPSLKELHLDMLVAPAHASRPEIAPLTDDILKLCDPVFARTNNSDCLMPNLEVLSYSGVQEFSWSQMMHIIELRTIGTTSSSSFIGTSPETNSSDLDGKTTNLARLKEISFSLTLFSAEEVAAVNALVAPSLETGLNWNLETTLRV